MSDLQEGLLIFASVGLVMFAAGSLVASNLLKKWIVETYLEVGKVKREALELRQRLEKVEEYAKFLGEACPEVRTAKADNDPWMTMFEDVKEAVKEDKQ